MDAVSATDKKIDWFHNPGKFVLVGLFIAIFPPLLATFASSSVAADRTLGSISGDALLSRAVLTAYQLAPLITLVSVIILALPFGFLGLAWRSFSPIQVGLLLLWSIGAVIVSGFALSPLQEGSTSQELQTEVVQSWAADRYGLELTNDEASAIADDTSSGRVEGKLPIRDGLQLSRVADDQYILETDGAELPQNMP